MREKKVSKKKGISKRYDIKKSVKEEREWLKEKFKIKKYKLMSEETSLFGKFFYWIISIVFLLFFLYMENKVYLNIFERGCFVYFVTILFMGALLYTSKWSVVRETYKLATIPMILLFNILRWIGISYVFEHLNKCLIALFLSISVCAYVLWNLPELIPYMEKWILANATNVEEACQMFWFCASLLTVLCGMVILYVLLRMMFIVFVVGDRTCKINIFNKIWNEMKLLFYIVSVVLQFKASISSVLPQEIKYFIDAVIFFMLLDSYIDKRKECVL